MLTYGGYSMLIDADGEAAAFIKKYMPVELYMPWRRPSWPGYGTLQMTYPRRMYAEPELVINRLHWPCRDMSRWAFIHLLCNSDTVAALLPLSCINGQYQPLPLIISNVETGGETITIPSMYMLPPTPLSGIRGLSQADTGNQSLYLLTLVDLRYLLWYADTGDVVTDWDVLDGLTTEPFIAWGTIVGQCVSRANEAGYPFFAVMGNISENYLTASLQMFAIEYEPIPQVLDAVAFNVGQRWTAPFYAGPNGVYISTWCSEVQGGQVGWPTALQIYQADVAANPDRVILSGGMRYNSPL